MLETLILSALALIWPNIPRWVGKFLYMALMSAVTLIQTLKSDIQMSGPEKRETVIREVGTLLDEALDDVPEWKEVSEGQRDRILTGLVELALFIDDAVSGDRKGQVNIMRKMRVLRRQLGVKQ